uniref:CARD domain-containing protein n=1 Tax=Plectus sambesii TaxID=2011161 RepID=A0A914W301_9BILA
MAIPRKSTRNMRLVDFVKEAGPSAFPEFISALLTCNQEYLAEAILAHLPLTSMQQIIPESKPIERDMDFEFSDDSLNRECLTTCLPILCAEMIVDEMVVRLESDKCLTYVDADVIRAKSTSFEKNLKLINYVQKRGPEAFSCFMKSLKETRQDHIFNKLIKERNLIAEHKNLR